MEAYSVIRGEGNMQMAFIFRGLDRGIGNLPNSTDPLGSDGFDPGSINNDEDVSLSVSVHLHPTSSSSTRATRISPSKDNIQ